MDDVPVAIDLIKFVVFGLYAFVIVNLCCSSHVVVFVVSEFVLGAASETVFAVVNFEFDCFGGCCVAAGTQDICF